MKTYSLKSKDIVRKWHLLDASETSIGRVATVAAGLLMGKQKPSQTPHMDGGDYVVIINSDQIVVTGNKALDKLYRKHSGYPGGLKEKALRDVAAENSAQVIRQAIRGMLPVNKLRAGRLRRLKVYPTAEHPHEGQSPEAVSFAKRNDK